MTDREWWETHIRPYLPNDEREWDSLTDAEREEVADLRKRVAQNEVQE